MKAQIVLCFMCFCAVEGFPLALNINYGCVSAKNTCHCVAGNKRRRHYSPSISMAGTAIDPFESLRSRMPKESFDLLVSNVDPSTVSAADLVILSRLNELGSI
jgi:hypothetical protein